MSVHYLGDSNPDGTVLGLTASEKIAFYNATPVVQPTAAAQAAVSTSVPLTISAGFGFANSAQMIALIATVNAMRTGLVSLGLLKGS